MKKGDYVSIMGFFKLTPTDEMELERIAVTVERERNNTGDMRLLLLKHAYVNIENQEKISSALTSDKIAKEMKAMVMEAFDREIGIDMELLKSEKDKTNEELKLRTSKKKKFKVEVGTIMFSSEVIRK
ncbi:hypothetical protein G6F42_013777 [Rhizopus arrhizus]|nr:hypothetical protein G6F42_013777 [Rhizopus arrhizus]